MGGSKTAAVTIGRYAIFGEIASGGMATVHYGRLVGPVGFSRTVAIKKLHAHFAKDPEFVAMFLDEARLAARIQHPNVVPTLDVVNTGGELFLVMEYVQGETLSRLVRAARDRGEVVPPPVVASILIHALHGLHAAHEAKDERGVALGIVHRDVSPQNVLVGVDGVARVLDFGVAKAQFRLQTTRDGQLKGKLAYMAPEQIGGHVDRWSDIYAMGVLLWEALTARRLYEASNEAQLIQQVLQGKSEPPSKHVKDLPVAFDEIAMHALKLDPKQRFQTAREMALALERSVEVAMTSAVGEWVERVARDRLTERAAAIAEIESSTSQARAAHKPESVTRIETATTPVSSRKDPAASRRKILVIDDSEVMCSRIRRALEAENFDVVTTTRAVGNARHIPSCDLVIIDFHMPGIDGGTVIQSLRAAAASPARGEGERGQSCKFYLYTSDPQITKEYQKLGFDGVLTEKGDEAALVRQVKAVFRMMQMRVLQMKVKKD